LLDPSISKKKTRVPSCARTFKASVPVGEGSPLLRVVAERLGERDRERTREVGVQVQPMRTWCRGSGEELCDGF